MAETTDKLKEKLKSIAVSFIESNEKSLFSEIPGGKTDENNEKQDYRAIKRVKFASGTDSGNKPYVPLAQSKKRPKAQNKNKLILGIWGRLGAAGEYQQLKETLDQFGLQYYQKMLAFFVEEGSTLLMYGVLHYKEPKFLSFICQYVPKELLREILRNDNYEALKSLLLAHTSLEKYRAISKEDIEEASEKFNLLFSIDLEGLENYMKSDYFNHRFAEGVKTNFRQVMEKYKAPKLTTKH